MQNRCVFTGNLAVCDGPCSAVSATANNGKNEVDVMVAQPLPIGFFDFPTLACQDYLSKEV